MVTGGLQRELDLLLARPRLGLQYESQVRRSSHMSSLRKARSEAAGEGRRVTGALTTSP